MTTSDTASPGSADLPRRAWFATSAPFPAAASVPEIVDAGLLADPTAVVVRDRTGTTLTATEVYSQSCQLAHTLAAAGLSPGARVIVLLDHVPAAVPALLGCLRAAVAYVPIDARWPIERIAAIINQVDPGAVISDVGQLPLLDALDRHGVLPATQVIVDGPDDPWLVGLDDHAGRELWDELAGEIDDGRAAGFNLRRTEFTNAEIGAYADHVSAQVLACTPPGGLVVDLGAGSGLVTGRLLAAGRDVIAVDSSPALASRLRLRPSPQSAGTDGQLSVECGYAHEVSDLVSSVSADAVLLSSVVQFFPSVAYLDRVIAGAIRTLRPGGSLVLCDLLDPATESDAGFALTPERMLRLLSRPEFDRVDVLRREHGRFPDRLAGRYDVVATLRSDADGRKAAPTASTLGALDLAAAPSHDLGVAGPDALAYVIFTSGSSGIPKGVAVEHRSVVNLLVWVNATFGIDAGTVGLAVSEFSFDLSVYDVFGLLAAGGCVYLVSDDLRREPAELAAVLESGAVTFWNSAPAALVASLVFVEPDDSPARRALRLVFLSGDWVPLSMLDSLQARFPEADLVALGGATECTVWSNSYRVDRVGADWPSIPYGKPMHNAVYHVLDANLSTVPIGEPGNLYIGGVCLALGYYGDAKLTDAKFRRHPIDGSRIYATGDRAMWLSDGNMRFLGRLDDQVKIAGYRIELGDVRAALVRSSAVLDAIAFTVPGVDGPTLAAYVIWNGESAEPDLARHLASLLPPYMVPRRIVSGVSLPLSAHGKVDRAALVRLAHGEPIKLVAGSTQQSDSSVRAELADLWARILGGATPTADADFFASGGSSLVAARLAATARSELALALSVRDIFEFSRFGDLVRRVDERRAAP